MGCSCSEEASCSASWDEASRSARLSIEERTSERNMNVTLRRTLMVCVLAGSLALALALLALAGAVSAEAKSLMVGPGESIQKAINSAHPGDTIVVKGVHREDVVIRKDGIKLRGEDAVIEPPPKAKADSPCAPEAICIRSSENEKRVSDVSVSGFTIRAIQDRGSRHSPSTLSTPATPPFRETAS